MAWFGGADPTLELDSKIEEATSEAIPNGELDIAVGLEITDIIRSKKVPPKVAMRSLKKRLTKVYSNPNLLGSTLKLVDLCVKNGGGHFIAEINSKEFVDYLIDFVFKVHYDVKSYQVYLSEAKLSAGSQILKLIKEWSLYFKSQENNYLDKQYNLLVRQGYEFPEVDPVISQGASNFIDSEAPPDWIDGKECMICYTPFSVMNRKHHCRACGSVFCQTHSSKSIPLVSLGIMQPVRVCDDCYLIHKSRNSDRSGDKIADRSGRQSGRRGLTNRAQPQDDEDEQIRKAIELSLQESLVPAYTPTPVVEAAPEEDMDDDLKAAIAASLQESQPQYLKPAQQPVESRQQFPPQAQEPELEFYLNIMPFDSNAYSGEYSSQPQAGPGPSYTGNYAQGAQFTGQNPQAGQNQSGQQFPTGQMTGQVTGSLTPAQHIEQHRPVQEDLTQQEEEDINLYVQLMNTVKNDRSKQANILYEKDLGDLHNRVMQLKPKLNKSLRNAIEKYEFFLDMNNKLSTITRLYDLFLEAKLNQAYSKHYVSSPYAQYDQTTGGTLQSSPVKDMQYFAPGATGQYKPQRTGPQYTQPEADYRGYKQQSAQLTGQQAGQQNGQHTGPIAGQNTDPRFKVPGHRPSGRQDLPQTPGQQGHQTEHKLPYPMEDTTSYQSYISSVQQDFNPSENRPSEPQYDLGPSEPDFDQESEPEYPAQPENYGNQQFTPGYPHEPAQTYNAPNGQSFYPEFPTYPSDPDFEHQTPQHTSSSYPQEEVVSDAESVASRYPPVAGYSDEETETGEKTKVHASMRYPEVEQLDVEDLPEMPQLKKLNSSESKKFKSEPEPLIEL